MREGGIISTLPQPPSLHPRSTTAPRLYSTTTPQRKATTTPRPLLIPSICLPSSKKTSNATRGFFILHTHESHKHVRSTTTSLLAISSMGSAPSPPVLSHPQMRCNSSGISRSLAHIPFLSHSSATSDSPWLPWAIPVPSRSSGMKYLPSFYVSSIPPSAAPLLRSLLSP